MIKETKRILIIDDDAAVRKAFEYALEDSDYEVELAESGAEGIDKIRNQETKYDLVYLDMKMPELNGAETLEELRKYDKGLPIYIVTAFHKEFLNDLIRLRKQGINFDLLRKPLEAEEIKNLTDSAFGKFMEYD